MAVGGVLGDGLYYIPVFDDFTVLHPKEIDDRIASRSGSPHSVHVQNDGVALAYYTQDRAPRFRKI